nr:MAG TPA: type I neck protein [Caudoviricetes sp.]
MGQYVSIEAPDLKRFISQLDKAGKGEFKKELQTFMEALGEEFLRLVEDEIIRKKTVDTRLLLNSFQRGTADNVFVISDGGLTVEVGTNVKYAEYANSGHWLNPKGVQTRFVPGYWNGDHFIYQPGAKTGMLLRQKWVEGSHYWESAINIMEKMLPSILEAKMAQWLSSYFGL